MDTRPLGLVEGHPEDGQAGAEGRLCWASGASQLTEEELGCYHS